MLGKLSRHLPLFAPWQTLAVFLCGVVAWAAGTVLVMYLILSSLQRAALEETERGKGGA